MSAAPIQDNVVKIPGIVIKCEHVALVSMQPIHDDKLKSNHCRPVRTDPNSEKLSKP